MTLKRNETKRSGDALCSSEMNRHSSFDGDEQQLPITKWLLECLKVETSCSRSSNEIWYGFSLFVYNQIVLANIHGQLRKCAIYRCLIFNPSFRLTFAPMPFRCDFISYFMFHVTIHPKQLYTVIVRLQAEYKHLNVSWIKDDHYTLACIAIDSIKVFEMFMLDTIW